MGSKRGRLFLDLCERERIGAKSTNDERMNRYGVMTKINSDMNGLKASMTSSLSPRQNPNCIEVPQ
jgi:hypothetical protein